jgi:hypothetical protein
MSGMNRKLDILIRRLCCVECERPWLDPPERWRAYLTDEDPGEAVFYCPECARREFDSE